MAIPTKKFKPMKPLSLSISSLNLKNSLSNKCDNDLMIDDSTNEIESRINEWLDRNNICMVKPEDIIHDYYHKKRI